MLFRRDPPLELPFLTECKDATSHIVNLSNSLSNSESHVTLTFEDYVDDIINMLLGVPNKFFSWPPVFDGVSNA